jgi:molybdenum cofactor synthesis domain-containing protein
MIESSINAAIITVSDTRRSTNDLSGKRLVELLHSAGAEIVESMIVADDLEHLRSTLYTRGTGFGPRDNTPEATQAVIEREAPGLAEAMRRETAVKTPMAMLSRGLCGIRGTTLIINLPGSPRGVEECFEVIRPVLKHAIGLIMGQAGH